MERPETPVEEREPEQRRNLTMSVVGTGLVGGFLGTLGMMASRRLAGSKSGPPPTSAFWAKYIGDGEPSDYKREGLVLHFLYGSVAGAVFQLSRSVVGRGDSDNAKTHPISGGLAYGVLLAIWGFVVVLRMVLEKDPGVKKARKFLKGHLAYGLTLGLWTKLTEIVWPRHRSKIPRS